MMSYLLGCVIRCAYYNLPTITSSNLFPNSEKSVYVGHDSSWAYLEHVGARKSILVLRFNLLLAASGQGNTAEQYKN